MCSAIFFAAFLHIFHYLTIRNVMKLYMLSNQLNKRFRKQIKNPLKSKKKKKNTVSKKYATKGRETSINST